MISDRVKRVEMFGVPMASMTLPNAAEMLAEISHDKNTQVVNTCNVEHLVLMNSNEEFFNAYKRADWIFPDGMPLVWFSRLIGRRFPERVTGSDLLPEICRIAEKKGLRIFLLGGTSDVTPLAQKKLLELFPKLQIAGIATPWINLEECGEHGDNIVDIINATHPDIIFVGFGAPKQEIWTDRNRHRLKTGVVCMVGGTFNFLARKTIRAPRWMQKAGLEWFWRLFHEPKRLWKRYLIGSFIFLRLVWKEWRIQRRKRINSFFE